MRVLLRDDEIGHAQLLSESSFLDVLHLLLLLHPGKRRRQLLQLLVVPLRLSATILDLEEQLCRQGWNDWLCGVFLNFHIFHIFLYDFKDSGVTVHLHQLLVMLELLFYTIVLGLAQNAGLEVP